MISDGKRTARQREVPFLVTDEGLMFLVGDKNRLDSPLIYRNFVAREGIRLVVQEREERAYDPSAQLLVIEERGIRKHCPGVICYKLSRGLGYRNYPLSYMHVDPGNLQ